MSVWQGLWNPKNVRWMHAVSFFTPAGPTDFYWRYKRIKSLLNGTNLSNSSIVELGSGSGVMSIKLAREFNARVSLIDSSDNALMFSQQIAREIYGINGNQISCVKKDLFDFNEKGFDLVHSQGVIEHFEPADDVIKKHILLAKKNGYVLILGPRNSTAYRFIRRVADLIFGKWPFGFEKPVPKKEVLRIFKENNVKLLKYKQYLFSYAFLGKRR